MGNPSELVMQFPSSRRITGHFVAAIITIVHVSNIMWLPTPIYERVPQLLLLLGVLFMSSGIYLSFDYELSYFYFGASFACCMLSLWVFSVRLRNQKARRSEQSSHVEQHSIDNSKPGVETNV